MQLAVCLVYSVLLAGCCLQLKVFIVMSAVLCVARVFNPQHVVYSVQYVIYSVQCFVYSVQCVVYSE